MLYTFFITIAMCVFYFAIYWTHHHFWPNHKTSLDRRSFWAVLGIFIASNLISLFALTTDHVEFGNRILHAVGGGVLGYLAWFLAVRNFNLPLGRLSGFVIGFMLITTLGVANEIAEFILQEYFHYGIFALSDIDAWLDLTSNTIGILCATLVVLPLWPKKQL